MSNAVQKPYWLSATSPLRVILLPPFLSPIKRRSAFPVIDQEPSRSIFRRPPPGSTAGSHLIRQRTAIVGSALHPPTSHP